MLPCSSNSADAYFESPICSKIFFGIVKHLEPLGPLLILTTEKSDMIKKVHAQGYKLFYNLAKIDNLY